MKVCRCLQPAPFVYKGICELFEMYLVHVFAAFADVSLSTILNPVAAEVGHNLSPVLQVVLA